jgi:hypothetical protein
MSWTQINLKTVNPSDLNLVADGVYTFQLLPGAKYNDFGGIYAAATILSEGEFQGKRVSFSYPNPDEYNWSAPALKRLVVATGNDSEDNEDPVAVLNRIAGGRFSTKIVNKDDKAGVKRSNLQTMSVKPAA